MAHEHEGNMVNEFESGEVSGSDEHNAAEEIERLRKIEITVSTFLHELDNHSDDHGPVTMSSLMWLSVNDLRRLVNPVKVQ